MVVAEDGLTIANFEVYHFGHLLDAVGEIYYPNLQALTQIIR